MTRREERELAFAICFERCVTGESVENIIESAKLVREIEVPEFASKTAFGVESHETDIDEVIKKYIRSWEISRISKTALSILRLSVYEILFNDEVPDSVSANEAVELAKLYGDSDDAPFINGVLSSVIKANAV